MTKDQFMIELAGLISHIPHEERKDALNFYEDYFADAGITGGMEVPLSMGTPKQAAESIINETGSRQNFEQSQPMNNVPSMQPYANERNNEKLILTIVLIVITAPIWFSILSAVAGILFGIFAALGGMIFGFGVAAIALIVSAFLASSVASGIFLAGIGLILLAIAVLLFIPFIMYCVKFLPWLIKEIINLVKRLIGKGEQIA